MQLLTTIQIFPRYPSARKVVKKSELTRWQAERIQKDAELTKYIHIDSSEVHRLTNVQC